MEEAIQTLATMGFSEAEAAQALCSTGGDLAEAVAKLLDAELPARDAEASPPQTPVNGAKPRNRSATESPISVGRFDVPDGTWDSEAQDAAITEAIRRSTQEVKERAHFEAQERELFEKALTASLEQDAADREARSSKQQQGYTWSPDKERNTTPSTSCTTGGSGSASSSTTRGSSKKSRGEVNLGADDLSDFAPATTLLQQARREVYGASSSSSSPVRSYHSTAGLLPSRFAGHGMTKSSSVPHLEESRGQSGHRSSMASLAGAPPIFPGSPKRQMQVEVSPTSAVEDCISSLVQLPKDKEARPSSSGAIGLDDLAGWGASDAPGQCLIPGMKAFDGQLAKSSSWTNARPGSKSQLLRANTMNNSSSTPLLAASSVALGRRPPSRAMR